MDERDRIQADEEQDMSVDIEGTLMDGLEDDPRFGHGVPSHLRGTDLDFIQMSGLTTPGDGEEYDAPESDDDLDPNMPVSFYEEGVDDVDSRREPLGTEPEPGAADEVIVPSGRLSMSSSIESLKEIVADLTSGAAASRSTALADDNASKDEEPSVQSEDEIEDSAEESTDDVGYVEDIVVPDDEPAPVADTFGSRSPLSQLGPLPEEEEPEPAATGPAESDDATTDDTEPEWVIHPRIEPDPEPTEPSRTPPRPMRRPDLAQAESLLQRLEAQTGTAADGPPGDDFQMPELPEPKVHEHGSAEADESVYNRPNAPARRRSRRSRSRRRVLRLFALLILAAALSVGGYYGWRFVEQQTATEADVYRSAVRWLERDRNAEAASAFAAFAARDPDSALVGDALLMAAHAHERAGDMDAAIRYYEQFRARYPDHPKVHRATTLLALAHVRNGDYEEAIALLQNPERRALDPDGYLASLRALGEAHAALGQIDEARSAYLRAASLEGNYTADEDYLALAELYQAQANAAADRETRGRYLSLAVDQWDFAMRSPGITESRRREIKARRDLAISELGNVALSAGAPHPETPIEPQPVAGGAAVEIKQNGAAADDLSGNPAAGEEAGPEQNSGVATGTARNYDEEQAQLMHVD